MKVHRCESQLELLTSDQLYEVHLATLEVLEKVGIMILEPTALKVLNESGAYVDFDKRTAKFPQHLIEEAVRSCPRKVTLCGRVPENDISLENNRVYATGGVGAVNILDQNGDRRYATLSDLEKATRIQDYLENLHVVCTSATPSDTPKKGMGAITYEALVNNTTKHIFHEADNRADLLNQLAMASEIVGGEEELRKRPIVSYDLCFVPPLTYGKENTEVLLECASKNVPIAIETDATMGGTSPISLIGTLVQQNAEVLCGITLAQLVNKGAPVIYMPAPLILDMKTSESSLGPESSLIHVASMQLSRYYKIPMCTITGGTNSKVPDIQSGYEKAVTCLMSALAGVNLMHAGFGMLDFGKTINFEQFVIDNEILGMVFRILAGITFNSETVDESLKVIKEAGPMGNYLGKKHTQKYFPIEQWMPEITDRWNWQTWNQKGRKDGLQRSREKVMEILQKHEVAPIPMQVKNKLHEIAWKPA